MAKQVPVTPKARGTKKPPPPGAAKLDYTKTPSGRGLWKVTKPGSSRVVGQSKTEDSKITKTKGQDWRTGSAKGRNGPR